MFLGFAIFENFKRAGQYIYTCTLDDAARNNKDEINIKDTFYYKYIMIIILYIHTTYYIDIRHDYIKLFFFFSVQTLAFTLHTKIKIIFLPIHKYDDYIN